MKLWKYNKITGLWQFVRSVTADNKDQWLQAFKHYEPMEIFVISQRKPPSSLGQRLHNAQYNRREE